MKVKKLEIDDVLLITPERFADERGFFSETFNRQSLYDFGIDREFVQDNHSLSTDKGVLRGLHFQLPPFAQDKLVRVTRGSIFDVAVDIRKNAPTYGRVVSATLSARNWKQIWVPKGFAHGFVTLEPETEVQYKVTAYYSAEHDRGIAWNDPALAIDWPVKTSEILLSDKDRKHPDLCDLPEIDFT